MNNEQLESLLEEALNSVHDHIPDMVQSLQQGTSNFAIICIQIASINFTFYNFMLNITP